MTESARIQSRAALGPPEARLSAARRKANHRIAFLGHFIVYCLVSLLVFVLAGFFPGLIVLIAWTIGVAIHGFFGVIAPALRERWVQAEVGRYTAESDAGRRAAESRHARSLAELSASVAHEIRNPVTAARSLVQQIAETPMAPENAEYAAVAVQELDRVERAIAHLLRFAREEPRRVEHIELSTIVLASLELLRERLEASHVQVRKVLAPSGELEGDPEKLRRVVANLVGNAIDALVEANVSAPLITVESGENLARTEAWLSVTDNGPGIAAEALTKIFTPFYTSKSSGTGLGLPLSRRIAEEHGGTLEATSEPGRGARFLLTLPLRHPSAEARR